MTRKIAISAKVDKNLIEYFEQHNIEGDTLISQRAADLALVWPLNETELLYNSVQQAAIDLPVAATLARLTRVCWNLEDRPQTPDAEKDAPVHYAEQMRTLAHEIGALFVFAPDRNFGQQLAEKVGPFADIWALQLQLFGPSQSEIHKYADPLIDKLKRKNPKIKISMQFNEQTDAPTIVRIINSFTAARRPQIVSLLYNADPKSDGWTSVIRLANELSKA